MSSESGAVGGPAAILVGPPGAGKSTIGQRLAKALKVDFVDIDAEIERRTARSIPDIFESDGEIRFREIEEQVVADTVAAHRGVVSLGGGAVLSERTRLLLRGKPVVYLELTVAEGVRRTRGSARPLLAGADPEGRYRKLIEERAPLYRDLATIRVSTVGRAPGSVVRQIQRRLSDPPRTSRRNPWPKIPGRRTGAPTAIDRNPK